MGRITIDTGFDITGFRDGFNKAMNATKRFVSSVTANISSVARSFDSSTAAISRQQAVVDELKTKIQAIADIEAKTPAFEKLISDSRAAELELSNLTAEYDKAVSSLAEYREIGFADVDLSTQISDVERLSSAVENSEGKAAILRQEIADLNMPSQPKESAEQLASKLEIAEQKLSEMKERAMETGNVFSGMASKIGNVASNISSKIGNALVSTGKKTTSFFKNFNKGSSSASSGIGKLFTRLKNLVVAAFVFNVIRKALREFRDYIGLALKDNQAFASSFGQIKGNLQTAFQPILDFIIPALNALMNALVPVTQALVRFVSLISGKSIAAMQSQAKAINAVGKSAGGAAKEMNKFLAPFDEIMQPSAAADGGGAAAEDMAASFEDMSDIDFSWLDTFKEKLLDIVPDLEYFFELGKGIGEKIAAGLAAIPWDKIRAWGVSFIEKFAALLNGLVASGLIQQLGTTFGEAINTALLFAYTWLTSFNFLAYGIALAEGLNNAISTINWNLLGATLASYIMAIFNTAYGLVTTFDWKNFGTSIGNTINSFFSNIDWKKIGQTISNGIIGAISTIGSAIRTINWYQIGEDVKTFLVNIDWAGIADELFRAIGNALGGLTLFLVGLIGEAWSAVVLWWRDVAFEDGKFTMQGLLDGIWEIMKSIGRWIRDHIFQPFIDGFKELFGIHSPSTVMAGLGGDIMQGLFNGVLSMVDSVIGLFSGLWEGIKNVWVVVADWFSENVTTPLSSGFRVFVNGIIGFFEGMANGVIGIFESLINWIINAINTISFDIPDWVPFIGGSRFGFNIPSVTLDRVEIPRLATGTVVPPNKEFMAILGDNKQEPEVVSPLSTIEQAVENALDRRGAFGGDVTMVIELDGREVGRAILPWADVERTRQGGRISNRMVTT